MSHIEGWAAYCARQDIAFDEFERGVRIMMDDLELWARRGFGELYTQVLQTASFGPESGA